MKLSFAILLTITTLITTAVQAEEVCTTYVERELSLFQGKETQVGSVQEDLKIKRADSTAEIISPELLSIKADEGLQLDFNFSQNFITVGLQANYSFESGLNPKISDKKFFFSIPDQGKRSRYEIAFGETLYSAYEEIAHGEMGVMEYTVEYYDFLIIDCSQI